MNILKSFAVLTLFILAGCAARGTPPPVISLDEPPVAAEPVALGPPPVPVQVVAVPELLPLRSEEHTSELQSLMRISYAVFCLKKKKMNYKIRYILYHTHVL